MTGMKLCPFCGKTETLAIVDCIELEECDQFEHCDKDTYKTVACCYNKGGCGASSGYRPTEQEAIDAWNTRHEPTCHMEQSGAGDDVACTNCGAYNISPFRDSGGHLVIPAYCPSCGCKVVD